MTLSDILGRDIRLELHEAVAVMRAIADSSATIAPSSAPELQDVELLGDGSVQLVGSALVDDPVRSLSEMLQALIGPASAPQLASLMEQPYDSVAAFSRDLAYFERPNRSLILQDLYARASGGVPVPAADELMKSLRATPAPDATEQGEKQPQADSQHRKLLYVAALLGVVAVAALLFAFILRGRAAPPGAPSTLTSKVAERVTSVAGAVGSAVKSIGERTGLASEAPPPVEATPPTDPVATAAASTPARGSSRSSISTSRGSTASTPLPGPGGTAVQGRITDRPLPVPATTPTEPVGDIGSNMVYAAGSADVVPPLGVRPHVPKELPPGIRPENVARIEIVVNPQGAVDTVKLVGPPRLNDAMLLSAAKAWRFRPAKRNGTPVPYRMTVSVAR